MAGENQIEGLDKVGDVAIPDDASPSEVIALLEGAQNSSPDLATDDTPAEPFTPQDIDAQLFIDAPGTEVQAEAAAPAEAPAQTAQAQPEWMQALTAVTDKFGQALERQAAQQQALLDRLFMSQQRPAAPPPAEDVEPPQDEIFEHTAWLNRQLKATQARLLENEQRARAAVRQEEANVRLEQETVQYGNFLVSAVPEVLKGTQWEGNQGAHQTLLMELAKDPFIAKRPNADQLRAHMRAKVAVWQSLVPRQTPAPAPNSPAGQTRGSAPKQLNEAYLDKLLEEGKFKEHDAALKRAVQLYGQAEA